jgi:hypothetical protein
MDPVLGSRCFRNKFRKPKIAMIDSILTLKKIMFCKYFNFLYSNLSVQYETSMVLVEIFP